MPVSFRATTTSTITGGATAKTIALPAAVQVGDLMLMQWTAGTDPDSGPTGWSQIIASPLSSMSHVIWYRFAQAGDAGSTVTVPSTMVGKVNINVVAYAGVSSTNPIEASVNRAEDTSQTAHTSSTVSVTDAAMIAQFCGMKDGAVSSVTRSGPSGYNLRQNATTGGAAYAVVGMVADKVGSAGTVAAVTWTSDQATANASMVTVALAPSGGTVAVRATTDVTLPAGASIVGGTTMAQVEGDDDPNTYTRVPVSSTAVEKETKFGTLPAPLQSVTRKVILESGTTSVTIIPSLRMGATVLKTYPAQTITGTGEKSYTLAVASADQTAQTNLSDIRWHESITGA